jgi:hypothetical protein
MSSTKTSASALLPRPTASDVRELYEAVDFHPEEEERKKNNKEQEEEGGSGSSGAGVDVSPTQTKAGAEGGPA